MKKKQKKNKTDAAHWLQLNLFAGFCVCQKLPPSPCHRQLPKTADSSAHVHVGASRRLSALGCTQRCVEWVCVGVRERDKSGGFLTQCSFGLSLKWFSISCRSALTLAAAAAATAAPIELETRNYPDISVGLNTAALLAPHAAHSASLLCFAGTVSL